MGLTQMYALPLVLILGLPKVSYAVQCPPFADQSLPAYVTPARCYDHNGTVSLSERSAIGVECELICESGYTIYPRHPAICSDGHDGSAEGEWNYVSSGDEDSDPECIESFSCGSFTSYLFAEGIDLSFFADGEIQCHRRLGGFLSHYDESTANGDACQLGSCAKGQAGMSFVCDPSDEDQSVGVWTGFGACCPSIDFPDGVFSIECNNTYEDTQEYIPYCTVHCVEAIGLHVNLTNSSLITCDGDYFFDGSELCAWACNAYPSVPNARMVTCYNFFPNGVCELGCSIGYGPTASVSCAADLDYWLEGVPQCVQVHCPPFANRALPDAAYGRCYDGNRTVSTSEQSALDVECELTCEGDYTIHPVRHSFTCYQHYMSAEGYWLYLSSGGDGESPKCIESFTCGSFSSFLSADVTGFSHFGDGDIQCSRHAGGFLSHDDENTANGDTCQLGSCNEHWAAFSYMCEPSSDGQSIGEWRGFETCCRSLHTHIPDYIKYIQCQPRDRCSMICDNDELISFDITNSSTSACMEESFFNASEVCTLACGVLSSIPRGEDRVVCSHHEFSEGIACILDCDADYADYAFQCLNDVDNLLEGVPQCAPVICPPFADQNFLKLFGAAVCGTKNGTVSSSEPSALGVQCELTCADGYTLYPGYIVYECSKNYGSTRGFRGGIWLHNLDYDLSPSCISDTCFEDIMEGECVDIDAELAKSEDDSNETTSAILEQHYDVLTDWQCCSFCSAGSSFGENCVAFSYQPYSTVGCVLLSSMEYETVDGSSCKIGSLVEVEPRGPTTVTGIPTAVVTGGEDQRDFTPIFGSIMAVTIGIFVAFVALWRWAAIKALLSAAKQSLWQTPKNLNEANETPMDLNTNPESKHVIRSALNSAAGERDSEPNHSLSTKNCEDGILEPATHTLQAVELKEDTGVADTENKNTVVDAVLGATPLTCPECQEILRGKNNLNRHIKEVHGGAKNFHCKECHKSFKRKDTLDQHMTRHTGERKYACELCSSKFTQKAAMKRHVRSIHEKPFKCSKCRKRFASEEECMTHFEVAHPDCKAPKTNPATSRRKLKLRCACPKKFKSLKTLHRHQKNCATFSNQQRDSLAAAEAINTPERVASVSPGPVRPHPQGQDAAMDTDRRRLSGMDEFPSSVAGDVVFSQATEDPGLRILPAPPGPVNDASPLATSPPGPADGASILGRSLPGVELTEMKSHDTTPASCDLENLAGNVSEEELTFGEQRAFGSPMFDEVEDVPSPLLERVSTTSLPAVPRDSVSVTGAVASAGEFSHTGGHEPAISMLPGGFTGNVPPLDSVEGSYTNGGSFGMHMLGISPREEVSEASNATTSDVQQVRNVPATASEYQRTRRAPVTPPDSQQAMNPIQTRDILQTVLGAEGITPFIRENVSKLLEMTNSSTSTSASASEMQLGRFSDTLKKPEEDGASPGPVSPEEAQDSPNASIEPGAQRHKLVETSNIKIPAQDASQRESEIDTLNIPDTMPENHDMLERPRDSPTTEHHTIGEGTWPGFGGSIGALEPDSIALQIQHGNMARRGSESYSSASISLQSRSERAHSMSMSSHMSSEDSSLSLHIERV